MSSAKGGEELKTAELGRVPKDWSVVRLGDISECLIGLTYQPRNVRPYGTLVLRSSNIQDGVLAFDDCVYVDSEVPEKIRTRPGDILICVRNGSRNLIGKCALLDDRIKGQTFGAFMAVLRTADYSFVHHQLTSNLIKRQVQANIGATINQITNTDLRAFAIPFPTIKEERNAIATSLSDTDNLLTCLDSVAKKKRDLKQAAMQQLLTGKTRLSGFSEQWQFVQFGELGHTFGGLAGKNKDHFGHGRARYIPFMNVMSNTVVDADWLEAVDVGTNEVQNAVRKGDLLFNGSSETPEEVGLCSVLLNEVPDLYLNSFCFGYRFREGTQADGRFFAYWFRSSQGRVAMSVLAQGATRYNIAKSAFRQLQLAVPPFDEQVAIADVLAQMDGEIAAIESRRDKVLALKQGMMQQLLTGRIRLI